MRGPDGLHFFLREANSCSSVTRRNVLRAGVAIVGFGLVSRFPEARRSVARGLPRCALGGSFQRHCSARATSAGLQLEVFQGNAADPLHDLGFGMGQGDFAKSGEFEFATAKFDDSKWRSLNLPHDWAVELPFVRDEEQQSHGYKPLGRRYPEPASAGIGARSIFPQRRCGRRISVEFDGAFRSALVFLNGYFIGRNDNGYAPFSFDLTDFAQLRRKEFSDRAHGRQLRRRLVLRRSRHLSACLADQNRSAASWPLGNLRSANRERQYRSARALVPSSEPGNTAESCRVRWQIMDPSGKVVGTADSAAQSVSPDCSATFTASAALQSCAVVPGDSEPIFSRSQRLKSAGKTRDAERITFGVRDIAWDADKGFFLNGKPVKIKGTCNHQDHAGVGAALPDRLQGFRWRF